MTCKGRALNASPSEGMPQSVPGVLAARAKNAHAPLGQERRDIVRRQEGAQQHLGCGGVEKDARPRRRQLLKLRILVEKGARDLAAEGTDQRLQIDALHHCFRVATLGGRSQLRRAGERPAPIGRQ